MERFFVWHTKKILRHKKHKQQKFKIGTIRSCSPIGQNVSHDTYVLMFPVISYASAVYPPPLPPVSLSNIASLKR